MLGIDARVEDLKVSLIKDINAADMPACLVDYILTEILNDVRVQRVSEVQRQREAFQKEVAQKDQEVKRTMEGGSIADDDDRAGSGPVVDG